MYFSRKVFYAALALMLAPMMKFFQTWFERQYKPFIDGARELYGSIDGTPILLTCLAFPVAAALADLVTHRIGRMTGRAEAAPPLALGCEALLFMTGLIYVVAGAALSTTFGEYPRPFVLGTLIAYFAAYFLVARALGSMGLFWVVTPLAGLGLAWPVVLPLPAAIALAVPLFAVALAAVRTAGGPERRSRAAAVAGFAISAATLTASMGVLMDYGLTLGLNLVPNILDWNAGRFARMERGCLATLARYPDDPVVRTFLADARIQQGREAEGRELARHVVDSRAGGAAGAFAHKILARLDAQERVRAKVDLTSPPVAPACAAVAREVRGGAALIAESERAFKEIGSTAEMTAAQLLPAAREAVRKAPECAEARALLADCARRYAARLRKDPPKNPDPADPRPEDLDAEAARMAAPR